MPAPRPTLRAVAVDRGRRRHRLPLHDQRRQQRHLRPRRAARSPAPGARPRTPSYPASCTWPSILEDPGAAPIYRQGTSADFADGGKTLNLPDGKYLISVLADGYKIDGEHFTVPMEDARALVTVGVQPNPLPDSTLRAYVFLDEASTNMAIDNGEPGLPGFQGHINDTLGEVTTDLYGNPLCTTYVGENPVTHEIPLDDARRRRRARRRHASAASASATPTAC